MEKERIEFPNIKVIDFKELALRGLHTVFDQILHDPSQNGSIEQPEH